MYPQTWNAIPVWKVFIVTKCILNSFFVTTRILARLDQEIRKSHDHIRYQNVSSKVRFDLGIHKNYVMVNRTKAVSTWRGYISYPQAYPQMPDRDTKKLITVVTKVYPKFRYCSVSSNLNCDTSLKSCYRYQMYPQFFFRYYTYPRAVRSGDTQKSRPYSLPKCILEGKVRFGDTQKLRYG